jgi:hypothetical protein
LKIQLKITHRTKRVCENGFEMCNSLEKRIDVRTLGRTLAGTKTAAHGIQTMAQASKQMIAGLQGKKRTDHVRGAFDGNVGQQSAEQLPEQRCVEGVARKNAAEKEGKGASATRSSAAIGTEHTLAASDGAAGFCGIVAVKKAVTVQRTGPLAEWAALLFERKSFSFR